jgi:replicative DNA helicase
MKKGSEPRTAPHNSDMEQALLGALMMRPMALLDIQDSVSEYSFYSSKHKKIFQTMVLLSQQGEPIDIISVSSKLKEKNVLDMVGGISYLTELTEKVPQATNVEYYAKIVAEKAARRGLIDAADFVVSEAYNEAEEIEAVLDAAEKKIFEVTSQAHRSERFTGIKEILPNIWETMEKLRDTQDELRGVPTGFRDLDHKLAGLQKSDLIILAARPSMGKTSLALDIARKSALVHNIKVGIFSLEMSAQSLVDRMLSAESRVSSWKMRTGKGLTEADYELLQEASVRLSKAPIFIDDQAGNSILRMRSTARRLKAEQGLELIIVDYLQLMTTSKNYDSMVNQVTEISRSLKSLARELEVPVLALSQLSRAVEARGGRPRLSDLRDSGAIEQDADVVMFIHREKDTEDTGQPNLAEILIEKHRNGPTGVVELYFDGSKTTFMDIEKNAYTPPPTSPYQEADDEEF